MIPTPADVKLTIHQFKEAIKASTDGTIKVLHMDVKIAQLFIDFLYDWDPDMPPRPICKILGPLVGDHMMNEKLNRLDDIADKLGPMMIMLECHVDCSLVFDDEVQFSFDGVEPGQDRGIRHEVMEDVDVHHRILFLGHAARHEASDRRSEIALERPHHGPSVAVWFGDHGVVRNVDPCAIKTDLVVTAI